MKYLMWLLKAAIFFTLFAFALNNQQEVTVNFFFGTQWNAPLVLVVLAAFSAGLIAGVLVMVPRWWMHRKAASKMHQSSPGTEVPASGTPNQDPPPLPPTLHGL